MNEAIRDIIEERAAREKELTDTITKWSFLFGVIGDLPGVPERLERVAALGGDNARLRTSPRLWWVDVHMGKSNGEPAAWARRVMSQIE